MRLCRFRHQATLQIGLYDEQWILPLRSGASAYRSATGTALALPESDDLLDWLGPDGAGFDSAQQLAAWAANVGTDELKRVTLPTSQVELLVPIPRPNKLFLLAGNYAAHIEEGGARAAERQETFPYVFMKPPTTTLTDPGKAVCIPSVSANFIDWELELAVVIGRRVKHLREAEALSAVAGYTVINDISNRKFRPNPQRRPRDQDNFFDWLHGKWADSFCPCGPCIVSADAVPDPQSLDMTLRLNGQIRQDASTAQQIFPVTAVIEFLASFVTLEPGDIISTGTPAGVGSSTGTYLKPGDVLEATISSIGTLVSPVVAEQISESTFIRPIT